MPEKRKKFLVEISTSEHDVSLSDIRKILMEKGIDVRSVTLVAPVG